MFSACIVFAFAAMAASHAPAAPSGFLLPHPTCDGAPRSDDFAVRARVPGGEWKDLDVHLVRVTEVRGTDHAPVESSMASFDFHGRVEVEIASRRDISSARVRPLSYGIQAEVRGRAICFFLDRPRNLSVEINGDIFRNLHLFANPVETERPDAADPDVIYFPPGIHILGDGDRRRSLRVPSGKTVYLAAGAVLRGQIVCHRAENVRILGRGMIAQGNVKHDGIRIEHSKNVEVADIFTPQCFTGGSSGVRISNVKCISYLGNGDGMNVVSSSNVVIDGVFNRNSDDCITVYGTRGDYNGGAKDITVSNSTLWADVAHPILVGTHGSTPRPVTLENLSFRNIDILDHNEMQIDYQGCLALNAGDSNLIRNVLFENIRIEDFRRGQLLNLRVFHNRKYCTSPGRGIENVTFRDIAYSGTRAAQSMIIGYDDARPVRNVAFENLTINGARIADGMEKPAWFKTADMAGIFIGDHVEGVEFR